jgi:hypothetical protein
VLRASGLNAQRDESTFHSPRRRPQADEGVLFGAYSTSFSGFTIHPTGPKTNAARSREIGQKSAKSRNFWLRDAARLPP